MMGNTVKVSKSAFERKISYAFIIVIVCHLNSADLYLSLFIFLVSSGFLLKSQGSK